MSTAWKLLVETYYGWSSNKAPRLAAALAYYTLFAMAPLIVIIIDIGALVLGQGEAGHQHQVRQAILNNLQATVGKAGAEAVAGIVQATVDQRKEGVFSSIIGWIILLVAAGGLFAALQDAINTIWEVPERKDQGVMEMVRERFVSFAMVAGIAFVLLVSLIGNAFVNAFSETLTKWIPDTVYLVKGANLGLAFVLATLLFAMIFKYLPDVEVEWRDVRVGAAVTTVLLGLGQVLLGLYLSRVGTTSTYGAAGSLVVILLWVYYSAQILLFGVQFTRVYAHQCGSRAACETQDPGKQPNS